MYKSLVTYKDIILFSLYDKCENAPNYDNNERVTQHNWLN